jgi:hypothetical protein
VLLKRGERGDCAVPGTVTTGALNAVWLLPGTDDFVEGLTTSTLRRRGYMMKHSMRDLPLITLCAHATRNEKRMMVPTICFPVEELVVIVFLSFQDKKKISFFFLPNSEKMKKHFKKLIQGPLSRPFLLAFSITAIHSQS